MTRATAEIAQELQRRRAHTAEQALQSDVLVGKDILELLSSAMYVDPLTIFREYVQNAADSIDRAYDQGLHQGPVAGRVTITLDAANREIRIRDNGVGIAAKDALRVLTAFGASSKRGTDARGFRGVGRLAALGYAQALVFRCKAVGDEAITEVRWDCRKLKAILLDPTYSGDLNAVVREVVSTSAVQGTKASEHFFEVVLERVIRIRNDVLLNEQEVARYLCQVAPLEFSDNFPYREEIAGHLAGSVRPPRLRLFINESTAHLTRPYGAEFEVGKDRTDRFDSVQLLEVRSSDGQLRALGWLLGHSYLGAIPSAPMVRGLRVRVGDIQVGNDDVLAEIYPERRFSGWVVGELHLVDKRVVPNGRRDDFEQTPAYYQLLSELAPIGREVARRCRVNSAIRNRLKRFDYKAARVEALLEKLDQGLLTRAAEAALRREAGGLLAEMAKEVAGELIQESDRRPLIRRLDRLRTRLELSKSSKPAPDPLNVLPARKRPVYEEVISLIYECSANRVAAKSLVDRIVARLATTKPT